MVSLSPGWPLRPYVCSRCLRQSNRRLRKCATAASPEIYDVAVVGGGPAGLSLLTALRKYRVPLQKYQKLNESPGASRSTSHLRLALIETQDLDKTRQWKLPPDRYSNRASSITPSSRAYLERIGGWPQIDQSRLQPYHHMRVWDGLSSRGRVSFDSKPSDGPIAYMTENQNITRGLLAALEQMEPVTIFDKTSVEDIQLGPPPDPSLSSLNLSSYPHVTLSSERRIGARLLVGADGINGPVRTFAGISTRGYDYDRHGVVATLKLAMPRDEEVNTVAYQRFLPDGPIALLALPDGFATLVWTTIPKKAAHLKTLSSEDFVASVNAAFRLPIVDIEYMSTQSDGQTSELEWRSSIHPATELERTGAIPRTVQSIQEGSIASFPLRLRQATTYTADRIALIGDAAHTIHPLAGQGLNMGLADSQALASAITEAVEHGADVGSELTCLNKYNSEAWMRNNRMLGVVDKLHWLYSMRNPAVVAARGLGLGMVEQFGGLKNWFMRQAGG